MGVQTLSCISSQLVLNQGELPYSVLTGKPGVSLIFLLHDGLAEKVHNHLTVRLASVKV